MTPESITSGECGMAETTCPLQCLQMNRRGVFAKRSIEHVSVATCAVDIPPKAGPAISVVPATDVVVVILEMTGDSRSRDVVEKDATGMRPPSARYRQRSHCRLRDQSPFKHR